MGIRFLCSTCGHKLNVKSFLAGKRGVCPQCGIGLDIPLESQVNKDGTLIERADSDVSSGTVGSPNSFDLPLSSSPVALSQQPMATDSPVSPTVPVAMASPVLPSAGSAMGAQPAVPVQPATPVATPVQPTAAAVPMQPAVPVQLAVPVQPLSPVQPVQPATPARVDPIDESPDAIWYVRPQSGGQYGPAKGEVMRKWIGEGRVASDSLVWREGWDDWMNANEVFPSLGGGSEPPAAAPVAPNPAAYGYSSPLPNSRPSPAYANRPRKKNSNVVAVTAVVVLGLMAVALLTIFVIVVRK